MCLGYLLYFAAFIGIALTVSAWASTIRTSLIVLLAFWIFGCLLIPRIANDWSSNAHKIPSTKEFWDAVYKDMKDGIDGHNPSHQRTKELENKILAQYGVSEKEDLPVNFNGLSLQASEEHSNLLFERHFGNIWKIHYAQERTQGFFGAVSPFIPIRAFSMGMAGTDLSHQEHFSNAVEQYRREFVKMLNLDFAYNSKTKDDYNYFVDKEVWEKSPEFSYISPGTNWAWGKQMQNLIVLLLWAFGAVGLAVFSANRMRIF